MDGAFVTVVGALEIGARIHRFSEIKHFELLRQDGQI